MGRRQSTSTNTSDDSNQISAGQGVSNEIEINTNSSSTTTSTTVANNESEGVSVDISREESETSLSSPTYQSSSQSSSTSSTVENNRINTTASESNEIASGMSSSIDVGVNTIATNTTASETVAENASQGVTDDIRREEAETSNSNDSARLSNDQGNSVINCIANVREDIHEAHAADSQFLTIDGLELSISRGNTVVLPSDQRTDQEIIDVITTDGFIKKCETYTHDQGMPQSLWTIQHDLDKYPSVTIVDSSGATVDGVVTYVDNNNITLEFNASFSGLAYLN